jgi:hypothetical protein
MNMASLDSSVEQTAQPHAGSDIATLPQPTMEAVEFEPSLTERKAPIPEDDRLLHFVSDRLAKMDSGRQRKTLVYWGVGIASAAILAAVAWGLWVWLGSQPS